MVLINSQFLKVCKDDVQEKVEKKINMFQVLNRTAKLIKLDSGDVVRPLPNVVVDSITKAVLEMGSEKTFKGRAPSEGYPFLIKAIIKHNYENYKVKIDEDEVFVNNGTKEDLSNIGDILCRDNSVAAIDPVFQTYIESNVIGNRAGELVDEHKWSHIIYLECKKERNFMPELPTVRPDIIYLSYPNDPTGCVMTKDDLAKWVNYAIKNNALILYDATYVAFVRDANVPRSIYEIKGAKKVAIEFKSFSKSAGFTGMHCGYTVIPKDIMGYSFAVDKNVDLNSLWRSRQDIKKYSPPYIIQRGAESLYSKEGMAYIKENVSYYMENALILRAALSNTKLKFWGGENSPFIWVESPYETSWQLFDKLLNNCHIVTSPGDRFGPCGKGFVRISCFANRTKVIMAATRITETRF